jgi:membrane protein
MGDLVKRVMAWEWVAHLLRAVERFTSRLGNQFAAAITYFSVLAIVPILMLAFSILGLTVTVLRPDLAQTLIDAIGKQLENGGGKAVATSLVGTLKDWRGVGIVALLSAAYAGTGWVGNIRQAINAMWHPEAIRPVGKPGILGWLSTLGKNLLILLGLIILGGVTVGVSLSATTAQSLILSWLHLDHSWVASLLTVVVALALSLLTGWVLFLYLYRILPTDPGPLRDLARGALFGSVGLAALQYFAGALTGLFAQNKAAVIFGPVIVLFLSLNIFATLVMLGAAWTATAVEGDEAGPSMIEDPEPPMIPLADHPAVAGTALVPERIARRGVTVGMVAGYALGGAAGLGFGAVLGRIAGGLAHRRRT